MSVAPGWDHRPLQRSGVTQGITIRPVDSGQIGAIVAVVVLGVITIFQLALALGVPLGAAAWGGSHPGVLPGRLRVASAVVGLVVYPLIALLILATAGLINVDVHGSGPTAMWFLTGFFTLGAIANFASRSKVERIWGPVTLVLAISTAVVAVNV